MRWPSEGTLRRCGAAWAGTSADASRCRPGCSSGRPACPWVSPPTPPGPTAPPTSASSAPATSRPAAESQPERPHAGQRFNRARRTLMPAPGAGDRRSPADLLPCLRPPRAPGGTGATVELPLPVPQPERTPARPRRRCSCPIRRCRPAVQVRPDRPSHPRPCSTEIPPGPPDGGWSRHRASIRVRHVRLPACGTR
jgi:hypothetical protein